MVYGNGNTNIKKLKMRTINNIVLHCTATSQKATVESIKNYWKSIGWKNPGYHYLIEPNGNINDLQPLDKPSNGVKGHNSDSIHISYIGGIDDEGKPKDNRTPQQILSTLSILIGLKDSHPKAKICGHRDFYGVNKACPSFEVSEWLKHVKLNA